MKSMNWFFTSFLLLVIPLVGTAQNFWEVGAAPGAIFYYGDLMVPNVLVKEGHWGGQLTAKRYWNGEHALRLGLMYGSLSGDDNNYDRNSIRGNRFTAQLAEFSLACEIDLRGRFRYTKRAGYQKTWSPYVMFGLSAIYCDPEVVYGQPDNKDSEIDYPAFHIGFPVGGGLKFDLNERIYIGAEFGLRITLSDYLDGTQASGNAFKNDAIAFTGVTAGYRFQTKGSVPGQKPNKGKA